MLDQRRPNVLFKEIGLVIGVQRGRQRTQCDNSKGKNSHKCILTRNTTVAGLACLIRPWMPVLASQA